MRKVNALIMASMLALSTSAVLAADAKPDELNSSPVAMSHRETMKLNAMQQHGMFDGLNLTEKQRQQMRDLMSQNYHDAMPKMYVDNMEAMHKLIIADKFDESAALAQAETIAKARIERQVASAKVNNQLYNLLTPEQKTKFNQNHEEMMGKMQKNLDRMQKYQEPNPQ
ncbi:cell-envelope stress modulator CpxP [Budvicia diplopodorum]|uniref:cell-envelope stress modulator CpxP n=1 Tax=Budvicia diplopodorum TaxID=1119056 RepID=UPI0013568966|nr:cell-envelope stress modulator CpxP [Budvicia diplopodorum]